MPLKFSIFFNFCWIVRAKDVFFSYYFFLIVPCVFSFNFSVVLWTITESNGNGVLHLAHPIGSSPVEFNLSSITAAYRANTLYATIERDGDLVLRQHEISDGLWSATNGPNLLEETWEDHGNGLPVALAFSGYFVRVGVDRPFILRCTRHVFSPASTNEWYFFVYSIRARVRI